MTISRHMVIDCESIGLQGEAFAVAWVVFDFDDATGDGAPTHEGLLVCSPEGAAGSSEGRAWVETNVPKELLEDFYLGEEAIPANPEAPLSLKVQLDTPLELRERFWREWERHKDSVGRDPVDGRVQQVALWADCLWPVEARFLLACVAQDHGQLLNATVDGSRDFEGPYPFHEIATAQFAAKLKDPAFVVTRERQWNELPAHHPLADARQSARQLCDALAILCRGR